MGGYMDLSSFHLFLVPDQKFEYGRFNFEGYEE